MRTIIAFDCEGQRLLATLDKAAGATGVLIVSGGNETRTGAHRGMAMLAQRLAADGIPVLRFDRRGVGDSAGVNGGYASGMPDLIAAVALFRAAGVRRVVGLGNCDGATALALFGAAVGLDALVLTNPWLGDDDALPPPAAIRARYWARLRDPASWRRGFDLRKLAGGLASLSRKRSALPLAARMATALPDLPTTIVLATGDRTAQLFGDAWTGPGIVVTLETASHSFADTGAALQDVIAKVVRDL